MTAFTIPINMDSAIVAQKSAKVSPDLFLAYLFYPSAGCGYGIQKSSFAVYW